MALRNPILDRLRSSKPELNWYDKAQKLHGALRKMLGRVGGKGDPKPSDALVREFRATTVQYRETMARIAPMADLAAHPAFNQFREETLFRLDREREFFAARILSMAEQGASRESLGAAALMFAIDQNHGRNMFNRLIQAEDEVERFAKCQADLNQKFADDLNKERGTQDDE